MKTKKTGNGMFSEAERNAVLKAVSRLPKMQASLVVLHYLENKPFEDVAKTLQLSHDEMTVHHHAALIALRRLKVKI